MSSSPPPSSKEETILVEEESWDLPSDFDLYSTHQVRKVCYPNKEERNRSRNPNRNPNPNQNQFSNNHQEGHQSQHQNQYRYLPSHFEIECIEPSSPLDVLNKSQSLAKYDATGHCVWTGAFLLIACIDQVLDIIDINMSKNIRKNISQNNDIDIDRTINDENRSQNENNNVKLQNHMIELGCGTGIGGLAILCATGSNNNDNNSTPASTPTSTCCFTDYDPAVLKVCQRNCQLNGLIEQESYQTQQLTWGDDDNCDKIIQQQQQQQQGHGAFDVVLATDVLYDVDLIPPLFTTVSKLLSLSEQEEDGEIHGRGNNNNNNNNTDIDNESGESIDNDSDENKEGMSTGMGTSTSTSSGIFILSHVPRACYNDNNPPEAVEDLEQYIIDQARDNYGLKLINLIRPPSSLSSSSSLTSSHCKDDHDESRISLDEGNINSFSDSAILIFCKI